MSSSCPGRPIQDDWLARFQCDLRVPLNVVRDEYLFGRFVAAETYNTLEPI